MSGEQMDLQVLSIIVALCIIFLTIVYFLYRRSKTARRVILLTGISNSGKTLLFAQLIHNKYANTHTSIRENSDFYETEKGSLQIVDIPGHERLRDMYLEQYKKSARGLIFVIDSLTFQKEIRDVAEYLYNILTDPVLAVHCKNVMIFCNKQDNSIAKRLPVIKPQLEKEMNTVRMTKGSQLTSTEEAGVKPIFLGSEDVDFEFSQCNNVKFSFGEGSAVSLEEDDGQPNIEVLKQWLIMVA